jgi:tetratricopeptide (TPR) repeat protein
MAIGRDPAFGPAYAGLATVLALSPMYDYRSLPDPYSAASQALSLADSALSLDPSLAEAYAARVYVKMYLWFPFEDVLADAEEAIRLEPSYADAHGWYAHLLARDGQIEESIRQDSIAIALDPLAPGRRVGFAANTFFAGRWDLALREADRALALAPDLWMAEALKTLSLLIMNQPGQCAQSDVGPYGGLTAMCLHAQGEVAQASAMIDSLSNAVLSEAYLDSTHGLANVAASVATYHAWVGNASESLAWFERSTSLSPTTILFWTLPSGTSERVRSDQDFWAGIETLRQEARSRVRMGG